MKETYENINRILDKICYHDYNWKLCTDLKLLLYSRACKQATQNSAASYVNGTAETNITSYGNGLTEKLLLPTRKCRSRSSGLEGKYLLAAFAHQTRIDQTVCESSG
ncbi:hypothetical protein AVEN_47578-1 [Araneus ventricosus]|uniref:Uncharacterized protein n=1 Tax=Araneus ventricosus TaxID=182803 RepID=A0A4Y2DK19_ARAVE|nr:hypothetical protein AVEN_47578-1 [Araneus ventricosus]